MILADSALNWKQKRTILTQEALRRLKNTSLELGHEVQCDHLSDFMLKLKDSGYGEKFRSEIVYSAKKAFEIIVEKYQNGIKPIHRTREQMLLDKGARKSSGYNWWQKDEKETKKYTTVLYVPPTPNGELMKMLKKRELDLNSNSDMNIKFLETGGVKFKDLIVKKNPFKAEVCENKVCPMCKNTPFIEFNSKNIAKCKIANVGYRFKCTLCKATYEGETARVSRDRAVEHLKDLEKSKKESPLVKHFELHHENEDPKFKIDVTGKFYDALSRQADESIRIKVASKTDGKMNSKAEFNSAPVARVKLVKD